MPQTWLAAHFPPVLDSLQPGVSQSDLDEAAEELGAPLPPELAALYRCVCVCVSDAIRCDVTAQTFLFLTVSRHARVLLRTLRIHCAGCMMVSCCGGTPNWTCSASGRALTSCYRGLRHGGVRHEEPMPPPPPPPRHRVGVYHLICTLS